MVTIYEQESAARAAAQQATATQQKVQQQAALEASPAYQAQQQYNAQMASYDARIADVQQQIKDVQQLRRETSDPASKMSLGQELENLIVTETALREGKMGVTGTYTPATVTPTGTYSPQEIETMQRAYEKAQRDIELKREQYLGVGDIKDPLKGAVPIYKDGTLIGFERQISPTEKETFTRAEAFERGIYQVPESQRAEIYAAQAKEIPQIQTYIEKVTQEQQQELARQQQIKEQYPSIITTRPGFFEQYKAYVTPSEEEMKKYYGEEYGILKYPYGFYGTALLGARRAAEFPFLKAGEYLGRKAVESPLWAGYQQEAVRRFPQVVATPITFFPEQLRRVTTPTGLKEIYTEIKTAPDIVEKGYVILGEALGTLMLISPLLPKVKPAFEIIKKGAKEVGEVELIKPVEGVYPRIERVGRLEKPYPVLTKEISKSVQEGLSAQAKDIVKRISEREGIDYNKLSKLDREIIENKIRREIELPEVRKIAMSNAEIETRLQTAKEARVGENYVKLYHGTTNEAAAKIRSEGLNAEKGKISLTADKGYAEGFANRAVNKARMGGEDVKPEVVEVWMPESEYLKYKEKTVSKFYDEIEISKDAKYSLNNLSFTERLAMEKLRERPVIEKAKVSKFLQREEFKESKPLFAGKAKEIEPFFKDLQRRYGKGATLQQAMKDFGIVKPKVDVYGKSIIDIRVTKKGKIQKAEDIFKKKEEAKPKDVMELSVGKGVVQVLEKPKVINLEKLKEPLQKKIVKPKVRQIQSSIGLERKPLKSIAVLEQPKVKEKTKTRIIPFFRTIQQKQESRYKQFELLKPSERVSERIIQAPKTRQAMAELQLQPSAEAVSLAQPLVLKQPQGVAQAVSISQAQPQRAGQSQFFRQPQAYRMKEEFLWPRRLWTTKKQLLVTPTRKKVNAESFIAQVRRKGQWLDISPKVTKETAIAYGERKVKGTLAASFRLRKVEGAPTAIRLTPQVSKIDFYTKGDVTIQRVGKRLSSRTEVKEIISTRKSKRPRRGLLI